MEPATLTHSSPTVTAASAVSWAQEKRYSESGEYCGSPNEIWLQEEKEKPQVITPCYSLLHICSYARMNVPDTLQHVPSALLSDVPWAPAVTVKKQSLR